MEANEAEEDNDSYAGKEDIWQANEAGIQGVLTSLVVFLVRLACHKSALSP